MDVVVPASPRAVPLQQQKNKQKKKDFFGSNVIKQETNSPAFAMKETDFLLN